MIKDIINMDLVTNEKSVKARIEIPIVKYKIVLIRKYFVFILSLL